MTDKREWVRLKESMDVTAIRSVFNQVIARYNLQLTIILFVSANTAQVIHLYSQKIEAFWNQLGQHSDMKQLQDVFRGIEETGDFCSTGDIDR